MTNDPILKELNKNEKAVKLLNEFNIAAKKAKLTESEYLEARGLVIQMAIAITPAAMEIMASEVWEEINGAGQA